MIKISSGTLIFITLLLTALKLFEHTTLPWIWVFCPLWIPIAVLLVLSLLAVLGILLIIIVKLFS